jgi:hypothetical protein
MCTNVNAFEKSFYITYLTNIHMNIHSITLIQLLAKLLAKPESCVVPKAPLIICQKVLRGSTEGKLLPFGGLKTNLIICSST